MDHSRSLQQCFTIRLHKNWWPWFMMSGCVAAANWDKGNVFSFLFRSEILNHQSQIVDNSISDFAPWSVFTRACCLCCCLELKLDPRKEDRRLTLVRASHLCMGRFRFLQLLLSIWSIVERTKNSMTIGQSPITNQAVMLTCHEMEKNWFHNFGFLCQPLFLNDLEHDSENFRRTCLMSRTDWIYSVLIQ